MITLLLVSCGIRSKPIAYGEDACHYCKMTIVDTQHAAEMVTKKGKVYKFDASECMLNHLNDVGRESFSMFLVNDYNMPGDLINASNATFLVSQNIPSPMGEFLTAFKTDEEAQKAMEENGGELYNWENIIRRFQR